jgi:nicotinate dehydrogenase subunit B
VVGIAHAPLLALAQGTETPARLPGSLNANRLLSAWLRVIPNGTVTVFIGKVEFGQGVASALA